MFLALLVAVSASAAPTLASPDFTTLNVSTEVARFCNEHLAQQLAARGVQVTTARQISAALGLERQRQLFGCDDAANSCMAELASALGVEGMLLGDIGKLGTKFQVNLRLTRSSSGRVFATFSRSVSREDDLLAALTDAAAELTPKIFAEFLPGAPAPVTAVTAPELSTRVRTWPLVPTFLAGGLAVASAVTFSLSAAAHGQLIDPKPSPGTISDEVATGLKSQGEVTQWLALGTLIGAGVSLGVNVVMYFLGGHETSVQAALGPWLDGLRQAQR